MRLALAALALVAAPVAAAAPSNDIGGTWDLIWQTKKGPRKSGYLVMRPAGDTLTVEMHGRGMVRAKGTTTGNRFTVKGTRMLVGYTLSGSWSGDRMDGSFKVVGKELRFTGERRRPQ